MCAPKSDICIKRVPPRRKESEKNPSQGENRQFMNEIGDSGVNVVWLSSWVCVCADLIDLFHCKSCH